MSGNQIQNVLNWKSVSPNTTHQGEKKERVMCERREGGSLPKYSLLWYWLGWAERLVNGWLSRVVLHPVYDKLFFIEGESIQ